MILWSAGPRRTWRPDGRCLRQLDLV